MALKIFGLFGPLTLLHISFTADLFGISSESDHSNYNIYSSLDAYSNNITLTLNQTASLEWAATYLLSRKNTFMA